MISRATAPGRRRISPLRVVTAVIALYALVLNAIIGGAIPPMSPADHGVLCLGQSDFAQVASGGDETGRPASKAHTHAPCCTVPAPALQALAPHAEAQPVAWPPHVVTRIAWLSEGRTGARAPPRTIAHPRGPPVV